MAVPLEYSLATKGFLYDSFRSDAVSGPRLFTTRELPTLTNSSSIYCYRYGVCAKDIVRSRQSSAAALTHAHFTSITADPMHPPPVSTCSWNQNHLGTFLSPVTPATSTTSSRLLDPTVVSSTNRLCSALEPRPAWYFRAFHLHPAEWYHKSRRAATSAAIQPNDHFVAFTTRDGVRILVPRPLLESSGGPLAALAGACHNMASIHSLVLYDDVSIAFATVSRFIACCPVDLSPRIAPLAAITAIRWHIHALSAACFASFELHRVFCLFPDPDIPENPLQSWPATLALWMPLLDPFTAVDIPTLPPRFAALLSRRIALTLSEILPLINKCRRCSTYYSPSLCHLNEICLFCATLASESQGFWYILWHHGLLRDILQVAIKIGGYISTTLATVVTTRLRHVISEEAAIALLCSTECPGGWSHALSQSHEQQNALTETWDVYSWRIMARVLARHASLLTTCGLTLAAVSAHVQQVSQGWKDNRRGICVRGEAWGPWEAHLAVAWCETHLCKSGMSTDDVSVRRTLQACVRLEAALDTEIGEEYNSGRMEVGVAIYTAGCACEMGCALERIPQMSSSRLLKDCATVVSTDWKKLRTGDLIITLMDDKKFKLWVATHGDDCGLFVTVQIRTPGLVSVAHNLNSASLIKAKWYATMPWSTGSQTDTSQERYMESTDMLQEAVCACAKCCDREICIVG